MSILMPFWKMRTIRYASNTALDFYPLCVRTFAISGFGDYVPDAEAEMEFGDGIAVCAGETRVSECE
jgi:hypothetical protein